MKILFRFGLLVGLFGVVLAIAQFAPAHAQQQPPMSDAQIIRIRTSCVSALNTLNQLHASDALLRVNRGQLYESLSTKLMQRFNTRAVRANFAVTDLQSITMNYGHTLDTFRLDYQAYEEQLSAALKVDCSKQPVEFYTAVDLARTKRTKVHTDVQQLDQYVDDYETAITAFEQRYQQAAQGVNPS